MLLVEIPQRTFQPGVYETASFDVGDGQGFTEFVLNADIDANERTDPTKAVAFWLEWLDEVTWRRRVGNGWVGGDYVDEETGEVSGNPSLTVPVEEWLNRTVRGVMVVEARIRIGITVEAV